MGTIRIEVSGGVVGTAKGKTFNVSDGDVNRLVAWAQARFNPTPLGQPDPPPLTVAQALTAWAVDLIDHTKQELRTYERAKAHEVVAEPPDFSAA